MKTHALYPLKRRLPAIALLCLLVIILGSSVAYAQAETKGRYSVKQLETLVAPVALYPDDLLSNVLAASTLSQEIVAASVTLKSQGGTIKEMPDTDWDPSVKALLYFPQALYFMDTNIYWTMDLGDAVTSQLNDVITAVQNYRKKASDAGNLKSCEQQDVVVENGVIKIESADPEVVYVPTYDYNDMIAAGSARKPLMTFAAGAVTGDWLRYRSCNWSNGSIAVNPQYIKNYNYPSTSTYYRSLQAKTSGPAWAPTQEARTQHAKHVANRTQAAMPGNAAIRSPQTGGRGTPQANAYNANQYNNTDYRTGDRLRATAMMNGNVPPAPGAFGNMNSGARTQVQSNRGAASMGAPRGGRR
jgi:hypothetical protein